MFRFERQRLNAVLGSGRYATVYAYQKHAHDDAWAVKHVTTDNPNMLQKYFGEIVMGFSCNHPSILPITGYYIEEERESRRWNIYMKMPRMQGTLENIIQSYKSTKNDYLSEKQIVQYMYTLVDGLEYLHRKKIAHRDIKIKNILFDKKGQLRLADIGIGKYIPEGEELNFRTETMVAEATVYAAPELSEFDNNIRKRDVFRSDCWSLGMVMLELCTLKAPLKKAKKSLLDAIEKDLLQVEERYSETLKNILSSLLIVDPTKRKSMNEVKKLIEKEYPNFIDCCDLDKSMCNLQKVKWQLTKHWQKVFNIEANSGLSIQANRNYNMSDRNIVQFLEDLQEELKLNPSERLRSLDLNLQNCFQVTFEGVDKITETIKASFSNLKSVSLNLSALHIGDESLLKIGSLISNLQELETLNLDFGWCKEITDQGINGLCSLFNSSLQTLESLSLSFECCSKMTDDGIINLVTKISNLTKLKYLSLNNRNCTKLTNCAVIDTVQIIFSTLVHLNFILLNFSGCYEITNQAITSLAPADNVASETNLVGFINQKKPKLGFASFLFNGCDQLTREAYQELHQALEPICPFYIPFE